jgi:hypothetical protein
MRDIPLSKPLLSSAFLSLFKHCRNQKGSVASAHNQNQQENKSAPTQPTTAPPLTPRVITHILTPFPSGKKIHIYHFHTLPISSKRAEDAVRQKHASVLDITKNLKKKKTQETSRRSAPSLPNSTCTCALCSSVCACVGGCTWLPKRAPALEVHAQVFV